MASDVHRTVEQCQMTYSMIEITSTQLQGLRTLCSDCITRKEICESEAKLIKLFGRQILAKAKLEGENNHEDLNKYPCLTQWLRVVGISDQCSQLIQGKLSEFTSLLEMREEELASFLDTCNAVVEDKEKMITALKCLHIWTEHQMNSSSNPVSPDTLILHWTTYTSMPSTPSAVHTPPNCHLTPVLSRPSISASGIPMRTLTSGTSMTLPANSKLATSSITHCSSSSMIASSTLPRHHSSSANQLHSSSISLCRPAQPSCLSTPLSPPPSPRSPAVVGAWQMSNSPASITASSLSVANKKASPPPTPKRKNKLYPSISDIFHPLTKSKSHESQLGKSNNDIGITKYLKKKPKNLVLSSSIASVPPTTPTNVVTTPGGGAGGGGYTVLGSTVVTSAIVTMTTAATTAPLTPDLVKDASCSSTTASDAGFSSASSDNAPSPGLTMSATPLSPPQHHAHHTTPTPCNAVNLMSDGYDYHPNKKNQLLSIPVSPASISHSMHHSINHSSIQIRHLASSADPKALRVSEKRCRFQTKLILGACDLCHKQVFRGKVCRYCKFKYHRDCSEKAAPACGLPSSLVDHFLESLRNDGNNTTGNIVRRSSGEHTPGGSNVRSHGPMECMSSSSCDSSSASSSPALFANTLTPAPVNPGGFNVHQPSPSIQVYTDYDLKFQFPDVNIDKSRININPEISVDLTATTNSVDSDRSDRTLTGSLSSDRSASYIDRGDSLDVADGVEQQWSRANSISLALKEWDIPYEDLQIGDKLGKGRFGTVYRGQWHGDVAIKVLSIQTEDDDDSGTLQDHTALLKAFKLEIAMLRKTRHENLALFMGACMKLPHLAVVTSLCKGNTIYTHTRKNKERLPVNKIIVIASQISQAMGYLHAKGIVHKDLKSRNVFLESGKVIITDFGLSNVLKLCHETSNRDVLTIPKGWLYYLPPEIMSTLKANYRQQREELPYTKESDVYAFGTLWYELLTGEWPFKHLNNNSEAIIWLVSRGMKSSFGPINNNKEIKDILMQCWSFNASDRPDFPSILNLLCRLPKKRLARSPSHPIHLSRSTESVF